MMNGLDLTDQKVCMLFTFLKWKKRKKIQYYEYATYALTHVPFADFVKEVLIFSFDDKWRENLWSTVQVRTT